MARTRMPLFFRRCRRLESTRRFIELHPFHIPRPGFYRRLVPAIRVRVGDPAPVRTQTRLTDLGVTERTGRGRDRARYSRASLRTGLPAPRLTVNQYTHPTPFPPVSEARTPTTL